jgi:hypothetical protein
MSDTPAPMSSTPPPTDQRRSNPVNGSVVAFSCSLLVLTVLVGVVLVGAGSGSFVDVVFSVVVFSSFDGDVPVVGVVEGVVFGVEGVVFGVGTVWLYPLVPSAALAVAGNSRAAASSRAIGTTESLRHARDPLLSDVAPAFRGLLEATSSVRVMPTSP